MSKTNLNNRHFHLSKTGVLYFNVTHDVARKILCLTEVVILSDLFLKAPRGNEDVLKHFPRLNCSQVVTYHPTQSRWS